MLTFERDGDLGVEKCLRIVRVCSSFQWIDVQHCIVVCLNLLFISQRRFVFAVGRRLEFFEKISQMSVSFQCTGEQTTDEDVRA